MNVNLPSAECLQYPLTDFFYNLVVVEQHHIQCPSGGLCNCTSGLVTGRKWPVASRCCCKWCSRSLRSPSESTHKGSQREGMSLTDGFSGSSVRSDSWAGTSLWYSISRTVSSRPKLWSMSMTYCNPLAALQKKICKKMHKCIVKYKGKFYNNRELCESFNSVHIRWPVFPLHSTHRDMVSMWQVWSQFRIRTRIRIWIRQLYWSQSRSIQFCSLPNRTQLKIIHKQQYTKDNRKNKKTTDQSWARKCTPAPSCGPMYADSHEDQAKEKVCCPNQF